MINIRNATKEDTTILLHFIKALAEYEKLLHEVVADENTIGKWLFCDAPKAYAIIVEWDGRPIGFALYFYNFSTFLGKAGIYIEDVFIEPEYRGKGAGKAVFQYMARKAVAEGCGRLEWWVLDWNQPAIDFYTSIGARPMDEWTVQRVDGDALIKLSNA